MCVNLLNIKVICTIKTALNLAVLDFCINTQFPLYNIKKIQQAFFAVVNEIQAIKTLWFDFVCLLLN